MSHGHYKKVCRKCKTIISQCRCADSGKSVTYGICEECAKKQNSTKE